ncbi:hypothetical protein MKX03_031803 [Papaver bracteatum]|nr:hypothetical protein MKX03_031803 [Papaver bracteatum]
MSGGNDSSPSIFSPEEIIDRIKSCNIDCELGCREIVKLLRSQYPDYEQVSEEMFGKRVKKALRQRRLSLSESVTDAKLMKSSDDHKEVIKEAGGLRFKDIGGLKEVLEELKWGVMFPLCNPEVPQGLGFKPTAGILLHGPPGCGKTKLAQAIANEAGVFLYKRSAAEFVSGSTGESEKNIRNLFSEAYKTAPSVVFIDEIDAIASKRGNNLKRDFEQRIVTQLLTCMEEPMSIGSARSRKKAGYVLVIGATNRPDVLDPALRRPGRFDREICLGVPDENARAEILSVLTRNLKLSMDCDFDLSNIAKATRGFVGADLSALVTEAGNIAMKRISYSGKPDSEEAKVNWWSRRLEPEERKDLDIRMTDFEEAVKMVQPSLRREGFSAIPNVKWEDIGGLDFLRKEFDDYIVRRIKYPDQYEEFGVGFEQGFLLYGPPGCGKTSIAKAVANEAGANFIHVKGPELLAKWVGDSELAVRTIFTRARTCSPCILFLDEVDAIAPKRGSGPAEGGRRMVESVLTQLLIELDGGDKRKGVFVIGATNRPEVMDEAIKRPGRLGKHIFVPLPSPEERGLILKALTKGKPISEEVDFGAIGLKKAYENLSGADLARVVDKAGMIALMEKRKLQKSGEVGFEMKKWTINETHFDQAVETVSPSVTDEEMVQPSLKREGFSAIPNVKWEDIGGLDFVRKEFDDYIVSRIKYPEEYEEFGVGFEQGFLLYGPPGCGKTSIAKAVANEAGVNFIHVKGPELLAKSVGDSELAVRTIFSRARTCSPCILFFDEVDAIAPKRGSGPMEGGRRMVESVLTQLLIELDGGNKRNGVFVIGATNRPEVMDEAIKRPGRLGKHIYVPLPSPE